MKKYGSISLRKDGYYYGRVSYNKISKQFYGRSQKEVQDKIDEWVMNVQQDKITRTNSVLFSEYCNTYIYTYKYGFIKQSSFDRLESILINHVKGSKIDVPVYLLDDMLLQNYLNSKRDLSNSSLKKIYNLVHSVLIYAYRKKDIAIDIAGLIKLPASLKDDKTIKIYLDSDVEKFQKSLDGDVPDDVYLFVIACVIILNTGLRLGEMLALTWMCVDLENNVLRVRDSLSCVRNREGSGRSYIINSAKTKKSVRDVPINAIAGKCFELLQINKSCDYVLSHENSFVKFDSFYRNFRKACALLKIEYRGVHALRHTFASRLIRRGAPVKVVSELLGHTSAEFTLNRYVHTYDGDAADAVNLLDGNALIPPE